MAKAKPKTTPKAPRKPRTKKVGKEVGIPTTQSEEIPTLDGTEFTCECGYMNIGVVCTKCGKPAPPPNPVHPKTLADVFLETPVGPPHPAFPRSLLPEGKGFEALGNPVHPPIAPTYSEDQPPNQPASEGANGAQANPADPISSANQGTTIPNQPTTSQPTQEANSTSRDVRTPFHPQTQGNRTPNPTTQLDANASHNVIDASQPTPQPTTQDSNENGGNVSSIGAAAVSLETPGQPDILAFSREGETRAACWERLRKQARLAGMPRGQGPGTAYEWATRETERLFPPKAPDPEPVVEVEVEPAEQMVDKPESVPEVTAPIPVQPAPAQVEQGVGGLGDLPPGWPELPANAPLQVEIAWVSANRLRVRSGTGVDLSRALNPAPSYSALSWLETSILFPSKFADISVKASAEQDDEKEHIRREKFAIEEIRGILKEMLEG